MIENDSIGNDDKSKRNLMIDTSIHTREKKKQKKTFCSPKSSMPSEFNMVDVVVFVSLIPKNTYFFFTKYFSLSLLVRKD